MRRTCYAAQGLQYVSQELTCVQGGVECQRGQWTRASTEPKHGALHLIRLYQQSLMKLVASVALRRGTRCAVEKLMHRAERRWLAHPLCICKLWRREKSIVQVRINISECSKSWAARLPWRWASRLGARTDVA